VPENKQSLRHIAAKSSKLNRHMQERFSNSHHQSPFQNPPCPPLNLLCIAIVNMDEMEEMRRSLAKAELCCHILQMESRANEVAKDTQESRVKRYREILAKVVGEGKEIKSLAQARLRCHMLEIDRDAEAVGKDNEAYRAVCHLQILSKMTGERVTNGNT